MTIESHTVTTTPQSATRLNAVYVFTDHTGETVTVEKLVAIGFDTEADALDMYADIEAMQARLEVDEAMGAAEREQNPDTVAVYQTQAEFDRRLLGRLMTVRDVHVFYAGYAFFQAFESRGGANKPQRATYLGVDQTEYDLVDKRFGDVNGIAFFINDEKGRVWDSPLDGWE